MSDSTHGGKSGKRKSVLRPLLLLIGVLLLIVVIAYRLLPPEPAYEGVTVSEWMARQVPVVKVGGGTQSVSIAVSPTGNVSYKFGNAVHQMRMAPRQTDETIEALMGIGAEEVTPTLIAMLRSEDSAIRDFAAGLLEKQNVIKRRLDPAEMLRARALVGFALLGTNASVAVPELESMIPDEQVGQLACKALVLIGSDDAIDVLHAAAKGDDMEVKTRAAAALRIWIPESDKPLIESLVEVLNSDDWVHHKSAIQTLSKIGEPPERVLPLIAPFLSSDHALSTRNVALETMATYGTNAHQYIPQIEEAFRDDSQDFRFDLIQAYRKMGLESDPW